MNKPDKINFGMPDMSPIRKQKSSNRFFALFKWRTDLRHFILNDDWVVWVDYLGCWVKIPAGFVFDGASVPKLFHSFINSVDAIFFGSVIHDFIYRTAQLIICSDEDFGNWIVANNYTKEMADKTMYNFSIQAEGMKAPSTIAYTILQAFGWIAWNAARKEGLKLDTAYPDKNNPVLNKYN